MSVNNKGNILVGTILRIKLSKHNTSIYYMTFHLMKFCPNKTRSQ